MNGLYTHHYVQYTMMYVILTFKNALYFMGSSLQKVTQSKIEHRSLHVYTYLFFSKSKALDENAFTCWINKLN